MSTVNRQAMNGAASQARYGIEFTPDQVAELSRLAKQLNTDRTGVIIAALQMFQSEFPDRQATLAVKIRQALTFQSLKRMGGM